MHGGASFFLRKNEKSNISILIRCRMALLKYHSIRHMSSPPKKIKKPPSGGIFYYSSLRRLVSAADLVIL